MSRRALDKDDHYGLVEPEEPRGRGGSLALASISSRSGIYMPPSSRGKSLDEEDPPSSGGLGAVQKTPQTGGHLPLSAATSSTSIATDVTTATNTATLGDALDRRIEALLRDWLQTADMLFSVHPVDGSLLMWIVDYLDGTPGAFRQAQVSFCARIPGALPLGDAMSMAPNIAIHNGTAPFFLKTLVKLEALAQEEER